MNRETAISRVLEEVVDKGNNVLYVTLDKNSDEIRSQILSEYIDHQEHVKILPKDIETGNLDEVLKLLVDEHREELNMNNAYGLLVISDTGHNFELPNLLDELENYNTYLTIVIEAPNRYGEGSKERTLIKGKAKELLKKKPSIKLYTIL